MKKSQLAHQLRAGSTPEALRSLVEILDLMIAGCHKTLETSKGDDTTLAQGKLKNCNELKKIITKQPKLKK